MTHTQAFRDEYNKQNFAFPFASNFECFIFKLALKRSVYVYLLSLASTPKLTVTKSLNKAFSNKGLNMFSVLVC